MESLIGCQVSSFLSVLAGVTVIIQGDAHKVGADHFSNMLYLSAAIECTIDPLSLQLRVAPSINRLFTVTDGGPALLLTNVMLAVRI